MTPFLRALFPLESESQIYAHIERLRLAEIERERREREDRRRERRCLVDALDYVQKQE